jgi:hypothetical protein
MAMNFSVPAWASQTAFSASALCRPLCERDDVVAVSLAVDLVHFLVFDRWRGQIRGPGPL